MDPRNDPKIAAQVSHELAIRDLGDINTLRHTEAFDRFFMRRMKDIRDRLQKSFEDDPMSMELRESTRLLLKQVKELVDLLDRDEATIKNYILRLEAEAAKQPRRQ